MIVGYEFDGDIDAETKWHQHDVYDNAILLIARGCLDHARSAIRLLEQSWPRQWPSEIKRLDHRVIQGAHDILAAAWRHGSNSAEPGLFSERSPDSQMDVWLGWLGEEVAAWREQPELIRLTMVILSNQNTETGFEAEDRLARSLRERFASVPWRASPRGPGNGLAS